MDERQTMRVAGQSDSSLKPSPNASVAFCEVTLEASVTKQKVPCYGDSIQRGVRA